MTYIDGSSIKVLLLRERGQVALELGETRRAFLCRACAYHGDARGGGRVAIRRARVWWQPASEDEGVGGAVSFKRC